MRPGAGLGTGGTGGTVARARRPQTGGWPYPLASVFFCQHLVRPARGSPRAPPSLMAVWPWTSHCPSLSLGKSRVFCFYSPGIWGRGLVYPKRLLGACGLVSLSWGDLR